MNIIYREFSAVSGGELTIEAFLKPWKEGDIFPVYLKEHFSGKKFIDTR